MILLSILLIASGLIGIFTIQYRQMTALQNRLYALEESAYQFMAGMRVIQEVPEKTPGMP